MNDIIGAQDRSLCGAQSRPVFGFVPIFSF